MDREDVDFFQLPNDRYFYTVPTEKSLLERLVEWIKHLLDKAEESPKLERKNACFF